MKQFIAVFFTVTTLAFGANVLAADRGHGPAFGWGHDSRSGYDRGHHGGYDGRWGHGWRQGWGHHDHGSRSHFSFQLGLPLFWYPYSYYGYNPYPSTVVIERQPPVFIQQSTPAAQPVADDYWYFCPDTRTYYPYTQTCPSDWLQVVPPTSP
ncbi:MAG: hypothetical protein HYY48_12800 [Gammaproteobacteria bacterium]|nr:hypothetical protein [Gammaproteobacteria bacterium]